VLITLSVVLTASVMFPDITAGAIFAVMTGCAAVAVALGGGGLLLARRRARNPAGAATGGPGPAGASAPAGKLNWRMPPLGELPAPAIKGARRLGLFGLRGYLAIAMVMVVVKIVETALGH
jgi:hypothetical protein